MDRQLYNLSHYSHQCLKTGRLQTLTKIPIVAGDSIDLELDGLIRLAPMRREVVSEMQVDIVATYVPYRHVYGASWENLIKQGHDEGVTLTGYNIGATDRVAPFLGVPATVATIPKWLLEGYNRSYDRYFRVQSLPWFNDQYYPNFDYYPTGTGLIATEERLYGYMCARLPHALNGFNFVNDAANRPWRDLDGNDADVASTAVLDIRDLARVRGEYRSELSRTWFNERYKDIMESEWGTSVNIDADQRPELLWRHTFMMSGAEVNGADDATLGSAVGKTLQGLRMTIPRKYFNEHGTLWVFALIRPPFIHVSEVHPLDKQVNPSYNDLVADPRIVGKLPPVDYKSSRWHALATDSAITAGARLEPALQHYRWHNSSVHPNFTNLLGYPFMRGFDTNNQINLLAYHQHQDFDDVFQTSQIGHAQIHCQVKVAARRNVADPIQSITAGA